MKKRIRLLGLVGRKEKGFSLLEYCAGASVILVVVWAALNAMGGSISTLLNSIGTWATQRAGEISASGGGGSGSGA